MLQNYAFHYETGEPIPAEMIAKIEAASKFNQGYDFGEVVEAKVILDRDTGRSRGFGFVTMDSPASTAEA